MTEVEEALQKIKYVLSCGNNAQAERIIEQYGFYKQERAKQLILSGVEKSLPTDEKIYDMAVNYIKRNGIIDNPHLKDEVFKAYKYGCYWMRKQLK